MGASCDLAEISTFYSNFPQGPHFCDKLKVSSFDMKLCPYQGFNQSSSSTEFQRFWTKHSREMIFSKYPRIKQHSLQSFFKLTGSYLRNAQSKKSETLQVSYSSRSLDMGKVSRQNLKVRVYLKSKVPQENRSKKSISHPNRNLRSYLLRLFLVDTSPTYGHNLDSKAF